MKKIFWLILALVLGAALWLVLANTWQTTRAFQDRGRPGTLQVANQLNASRWSEPLPLKKIHRYIATLRPNHAVVVETDRALPAGQDFFILYLLRDAAAETRSHSLRPLTNSLRLKTEADGGEPTGRTDSSVFSLEFETTMDASSDRAATRPPLPVAPDATKPTVPFVFAGAQDSTWEILWRSRSLGELLLVGGWILLIKISVIQAWATPFRVRPAGAERKGFIHPSLRRIEADAPVEPATRLRLPKPGKK